MKRIISSILNSIRNFFKKMSDNEAKRFIELYKHVFDSNSRKGR
jgi:hypothetical protein